MSRPIGCALLRQLARGAGAWLAGCRRPSRHVAVRRVPGRAAPLLTVSGTVATQTAEGRAIVAVVVLLGELHREPYGVGATQCTAVAVAVHPGCAVTAGCAPLLELASVDDHALCHLCHHLLAPQVRN